MTIKVIGAGLAGCEASVRLARAGFKVELYDMKPASFTPAHSDGNFCELVCSNSLKSNDVYGNACGLLKEEMRILSSVTMDAAAKTAVPAGAALAVDRKLFAEYVTDVVKSEKNITVRCAEVESIPEGYCVVSTGPLTRGKLADDIVKKTGRQLAFYDASSPIVSYASINSDLCFSADRYSKGGTDGDYINCPMDKEEYYSFVDELVHAEKADLHEFDKREIFEGCMPVEVMAARGADTLRFGPMKPVGLRDSEGARPYAVVQLRRENADGDMYNLVGFQTNLTFPEQKRVFSMIPALRNAEFLRYGVMHRNTFLNSPECLNADFSLRSDDETFFAGQIIGVEGYVESAASGMIAAINLARRIEGKEFVLPGKECVLGALSRYVTTKNKDFEPMNANYGILYREGLDIKDKKTRCRLLSEAALETVRKYKEVVDG